MKTSPRNLQITLYTIQRIAQILNRSTPKIMKAFETIMKIFTIVSVLSFSVKHLATLNFAKAVEKHVLFEL